MTATELATILREGGLDETNVNALVNNAAFQAKAASIARASEVEAERQRATQLQSAHDQAKQYETWYNKNYAAINELKEQNVAYAERYGQLDQTQQQQQQQQQRFNQQPQNTGKTFTEDDVKRIIAQEMGQTYGTQVTSTIMDTGKIVEKHLFSGRKNPIDWAAIRTAAVANGGNVEAAYDAWDQPERDKANKIAEDARVKAAVDQEVERRMLSMGNGSFPAGADYGNGSQGPSPMTNRQNADGTTPAYDRNIVLAAANEMIHRPDYKPGFRATN